jgi:hypothetical protein
MVLEQLVDYKQIPYPLQQALNMWINGSQGKAEMDVETSCCCLALYLSSNFFFFLKLYYGTFHPVLRLGLWNF